MTTPNKPITTLYIDTQNLGPTIHERKSVFRQVLAEWPGDLHPTRVLLYADGESHFWNTAWSEAAKEHLESVQQRVGGFFAPPPVPNAEVKPAHRYSNNPDKNAADITLVLDALDDIHTGAANFVAVLSNDSDFAGLLYKLREVQERDTTGRFANHSRGYSPFLLITHANSGKTRNLEHLPPRNWLDLSGRQRFAPGPTMDRMPGPTMDRTSDRMPGPAMDRTSDRAPSPDLEYLRARSAPPPIPTRPESLTDYLTREQIAGTVATGIGERHKVDYSDYYEFTYRDAFNVIRHRWPEAQEANFGSTAQGRSQFCQWFHGEIWPVMEQYGAIILNHTNDNPQSYRYAMLDDIRQELRQLDPLRSVRF